MTPAQTRLLNRVVSGIMLWALLMSAVAPAAQFYIARAQEATEEATDEPIITEEIITETPTETPTEEPTEEVTETPVVEVTEEATVEVTPQETAEPTTEPTVAPTQPPVTDLFRADFQNGDTSGWLLSPGWQLTTEGDNTFLSAATPNETATIAALDWAHFLLAAQVRISPDSQL